MDKKIIEASELPEGDKVYLKKDFLGWRIVNPIKNEDGSINWPNLLFGGWRNLISLAILIAVVGISIYFYRQDVANALASCPPKDIFNISLLP